MRLALLAVSLFLLACKPGGDGAAYEAPEGKRGVAVAVDKSQTQFLSPGDEVEVVLMVKTPNIDDTDETRSETLTSKAEVLRVKNDWADSTGLVSLALTPEEAQFLALAVDREDRIFLSKLSGDRASLSRKRTGGSAELEKGRRGLSVLVFPDQQEFLEPGDRVDLISARQSFKATDKSELTALTLAQDVLVLRGAPPSGDEEWAAVQLSVDDEQAKRLTRAVAGDDHLTIAVRGSKDHATRPVSPSKMSRKIDTKIDKSSPKT